MRETSRVAEKPLASQEGLCSMGLVNVNIVNLTIKCTLLDLLIYSHCGVHSSLTDLMHKITGPTNSISNIN
jgi:hypothetical protein